MYSIII